MLEKVGEQLKPGATARWLGVAVMIALMAGTTLAVLGTALLGWKFGLDRTDLATRINTVAAVSAFVLVAATLFIALIAYLAATGRPDLEVRAVSWDDDNLEPVLLAKPEPEPYAPNRQRIETWPKQTLLLFLVNRSRYSARNPGVRVQDATSLGDQPGWTRMLDALGSGFTSLQWDSGADNLIHGRWERSLPELDFSGATVVRGELVLNVTVAADGLTPTTHRIPIRLVHPNDDKDSTRLLLREFLATEKSDAAASDGDPAAGNGDS